MADLIRLFEAGGFPLVIVFLLALANAAQFAAHMKVLKQMRDRDVADAKFKTGLIHSLQGIREVLKELRA